MLVTAAGLELSTTKQNAGKVKKEKTLKYVFSYAMLGTLKECKGAGIVDMTSGTSSSRDAQCLRHPYPCLSDSLHRGHY